MANTFSWQNQNEQRTKPPPPTRRTKWKRWKWRTDAQNKNRLKAQIKFVWRCMRVWRSERLSSSYSHSGCFYCDDFTVCSFSSFLDFLSLIWPSFASAQRCKPCRKSKKPRKVLQPWICMPLVFFPSPKQSMIWIWICCLLFYRFFLFQLFFQLLWAVKWSIVLSLNLGDSQQRRKQEQTKNRQKRMERNKTYRKQRTQEISISIQEERKQNLSWTTHCYLLLRCSCTLQCLCSISWCCCYACLQFLFCSPQSMFVSVCLCFFCSPIPVFNNCPTKRPFMISSSLLDRPSGLWALCCTPRQCWAAPAAWTSRETGRATKHD